MFCLLISSVMPFTLSCSLGFMWYVCSEANVPQILAYLKTQRLGILRLRDLAEVCEVMRESDSSLSFTASAFSTSAFPLCGAQGNYMCVCVCVCVYIYIYIYIYILETYKESEMFCMLPSCSLVLTSSNDKAHCHMLSSMSPT
jgi:hypothetical protein